MPTPYNIANFSACKVDSSAVIFGQPCISCFAPPY